MFDQILYTLIRQFTRAWLFIHCRVFDLKLWLCKLYYGKGKVPLSMYSLDGVMSDDSLELMYVHQAFLSLCWKFKLERFSLRSYELFIQSMHNEIPRLEDAIEVKKLYTATEKRRAVLEFMFDCKDLARHRVRYMIPLDGREEFQIWLNQSGETILAENLAYAKGIPETCA